MNTNYVRDEASKGADGVALSYMLRGGASLTKPLTPSEASSPMPCRLSGEEAEIGESPDFSRGECQCLEKICFIVVLQKPFSFLCNFSTNLKYLRLLVVKQSNEYRKQDEFKAIRGKSFIS